MQPLCDAEEQVQLLTTATVARGLAQKCCNSMKNQPNHDSDLLDGNNLNQMH
jgi:hypothetical protein